MAGARDAMRNETIRKRRLQAQRNQEAAREERARLALIPQGHYAQEAKMLEGKPYSNKMAQAAQAAPADGYAVMDDEQTEDLETFDELDDEPEEEEEEEEEEDGHPLGGVGFASPKALDLAELEGLNASDFEGADPSGATGYTTADVRAILKAKADV